MTRRPFNFTMSRRELILGLAYLPIHTIALPFLISWHSARYPGMFTPVQYNVAYIAFSFAVVLAIALKYLRAEFDGLLNNKLLTVFTLIQGYFLNFLLNYILLMLLLLIMGNTGLSNPNDAALADMAAEDYRKVLGMAVFLGPIVEEVLFRGVVFGALLKRDRLAAYIVSIMLFALLHVWQYAILEQNVSVLLYALDYLPVGFILAWCYERSGNLWTPILFHMGINATALAIMSFGS
ncbi:MAG: lysostaphin resistance A-like protein [Oscillospiraceae bacterium]